MRNTTKAQFTNGQAAKDFVLAGAARLTLVSGKTGAWYTFRVSTPKRDAKQATAPRFVSLSLLGPLRSDFTFLGTIFMTDRVQIGGGHFGPVYGQLLAPAPKYSHGKKSSVAATAPSARAFAWAWGFLSRGELPPGCEVWHEEVWHDGRCDCCGRTLTVPESIESGIGPVCAEKAAT